MKSKDPKWDDICAVLQRILDTKNDSFFQIKEKGPDGKDRVVRRVSVKAEANRIIGSFPKEGRDFYQLNYGAKAADLLKEAVGKGYDRAVLADVSLRYLHTRAGAEATLLLGTHFLDRGNYLEASQCFERLLSLPEDPDFINPKTLFKAALAFQRAGDVRNKESTQKVWQQLERLVGRNGITIGKQTLTLDDLKKERERAVELVYGNPTDWPMRGGNPNRNAQGDGGPPFLEPSFGFPMLPLVEKEDKDATEWVKQNLEFVLKQYDAGQRPTAALPAFFPVAAAGKIIFRTYDGVYCVATREDATQQPPVKPGEALWWVNLDHSLHAMVKNPGKRAAVAPWWDNNYKTMGPQGIFFENPLIGSLSHDGQAVYFVDDIGLPPHPNVFANFNGNPFNPSTPSLGDLRSAVDHNKLYAMDMVSGKMVWRLGGHTGVQLTEEEEKKITTAAQYFVDCHFVGPPLPLNGKLYVMFEKAGDLRVACLDPRKLVPDVEPGPEKRQTEVPEIVWVQTIGSPQMKLPQDALRRYQGVQLAYSDGVLVCPTNSGAVVGLDIMSHSLLWAYSYRKLTAAEQGMNPDGGIRRLGGRVAPGTAAAQQERWRSAAPVIVNGRVLFTAYDCDRLLCLDLRSGETVWEMSRANDDLYLGGVFGDKAVVVGKNSVKAIYVAGDKQGQQAWSLQTGTVSGHGAASKGKYYLPIKAAIDTKEPEIWVIDVERGKAESRTKARKRQLPAGSTASPAPGNLLFYEGEVYSQTAWELTAFPQLEVKLAEMNRRLQANPKDPIGLASRGELLLDDGKRVEAIKDFKDSIANGPPEDVKERARKKLHEAITELLQYDFAAGEPYLPEYKDLCEVTTTSDDPIRKQELAKEQVQRKARYFSLLAMGREKQGKLLEAFDNYLAYGTLAGNRDLEPAPGETGTETRPDVWARSRIEGMIRVASPEARKPLEERIAKEWEQVRGADDLARLRGFVQVFGSFFRIGKEARLQLAEKLMQTNSEEDTRDAQLHLLQLRNDSEEKAVAAQALEALARLLIRRGLLDDAVSLYVQLGKEFAAVPVRDGKTGADYLDDLITDKRFLPYLEPLRPLWAGRVKVDDQPGPFPNVPASSFTVEPDGELLPFFRRHRLVMDLQGSGGTWALKVLDRVTGEEKAKFPNLPPCYYLINPQAGGQPPSVKFAHARGHLLVLNLNSMVYAFDLAEKKKLWDYNLFGRTPMPNANPTNIFPEADGGLRLNYADGWTQRLGQVGVIEPSYVCLQTRDGLVALDPARGTTLWTKAGLAQRVQLFGDSEYVFVVETQNNGEPLQARVLRAQDGTTVANVADFGKLYTGKDRVRTYGRNILLFGADEKGEKKVFRLYDALTGKDVWKREFEAGALLLKSDDPALAGVLRPTGDVLVIDPLTNAELHKAKLDDKLREAHTAKVTEGLLLADNERFYVALNRPQEQNTSAVPNLTNGIRSQKVNGVLYAFDKATGNRLWYTAEQFESQAIVLEQFRDLPVILAAVQATRFNNGVAEGQTVRVIGIDKRNGKAVYRKEVSPNGQFYAMSTNPKTGVTEVWRHDFKVRISPVDENTKAAAR
jgi:outer membrane protein assembly factor BamB